MILISSKNGSDIYGASSPCRTQDGPSGRSRTIPLEMVLDAALTPVPIARTAPGSGWSTRADRRTSPPLWREV